MPVSTPIDIGSAAAGSSNLAITTTDDVFVGRSILIVYSSDSLTATLTDISDPVGNTYTIYGPFDGTIHRMYLALATIIHPSTNLSKGSIITLAVSSGVYARSAKAIKVEYGLKRAAPEDITTTVSSGTSATPSSPSSGTLAQADEIIFGVIVNNSNSSANTIVFTAPFLPVGTRSFRSNDELHVGYLITSAVAAQTMNVTLNTSRSWSCMLKSFRAGPVLDVLQHAQVSTEFDASGRTPRITYLGLDADVQGIAPRITNLILEADFAQQDVRLAGLSLESDIMGHSPSIANLILEADFTPGVIRRIPPRVIA
jgi:hypothetical protein